MLFKTTNLEKIAISKMPKTISSVFDKLSLRLDFLNKNNGNTERKRRGKKKLLKDNLKTMLKIIVRIVKKEVDIAGATETWKKNRLSLNRISPGKKKRINSPKSIGINGICKKNDATKQA